MMMGDDVGRQIVPHTGAAAEKVRLPLFYVAYTTHYQLLIRRRSPYSRLCESFSSTHCSLHMSPGIQVLLCRDSTTQETWCVLRHSELGSLSGENGRNLLHIILTTALSTDCIRSTRRFEVLMCAKRYLLSYLVVALQQPVSAYYYYMKSFEVTLL